MSASITEDIEARAIKAFKACCDASADEREAAVDEACGADEVLRARVRSLLAADGLAQATERSDGDGFLASGQGRRLLLGDFVHSIEGGDDEDDPLPETLGRYRVVGLLGAGGMGLVYEAEQAQPKRRVALKTIHPHLRTDAMVEHFRREVELLGALGHAAIPQAYEAGEDDGIAWLAMELVRGRPLLEYTAGRTLRERIILMIEIIDGMAHAHAAGVVHCDLKPDNILVTAEGQPKVLDFGLAITGATPSTPGFVASASAFLAPEQRDSAEPHLVDARADVYALGSILAEVIRDADGGKPVARDLRAIVGRATAPDPAARYQTVRELGLDLGRFLDRRPVSARRPTPTYRLGLWLRRNQQALRVILVLLLAVGLFEVGGMVWGAVERQRIETQARARLDTVERQVAELEAAGQTDRADAVFHLYTRMPEHLGTRALHAAWVWRAEREAKRGPSERVIEAWAEAVTSAPDEQDERRALTRLANSFATAGRWRSLDHVLGRLEALGARAETEALRFRTTTFHRDFAAASRLASPHATAPIVAALTRAHRVADLDFAQPMRWLGRDVLLTRTFDSHDVRILDPRADFQQVLAATVGDNADYSLPRALTGADGWVVALRADGTVALTHLGGGPAIPVPFGHIRTAVGQTDQGGLRAVLGSAGGDRAIMSVLHAADSPPTSAIITRAPPRVSAPASDSDAMLWADLDSDGKDELVVALGAWSAYDLRVASVDGKGAFTPLARKRVGTLAALALVPRPGASPLIAAAKVDRYPSVTTFGRGTPHGPEAGIYLFEYARGSIEQVAFVPLPPGIGAVHAIANLVAGDFDGDGLVDLAVSIVLANDRLLYLMRQSSPGVLEPITVGGLTPIAAVEVDGDAASELLVRVTDERSASTWVLGHGDETLPNTLAASDRSTRAPGEQIDKDLEDLEELEDEGDTAFARVWRGARLLQELGLLRRAAENLEAAALLAKTDNLETAALTQAAGLHLELGDSEVAAELYDRAWTRAEPGSPPHLAALDGAARSWLAAIEPKRALERYRKLSEALATNPSAQLAKHAAETIEWLSGLVEHDSPARTFTWDAPLDASLLIAAPESVSRAFGGGLALRLFSDQDAVAKIPMTYDGGRVALELEVSVEHLEIGAGLVVGLRPAGAQASAVELRVEARGGDQSIRRMATCGAPNLEARGIEDDRPIPSPPERLRVRLDFWPGSHGAAASMSCRVWQGEADAPPLRAALGQPDALSPGPYELVLAGTRITSLGSMTEARMTLRRIAIIGLTAREVAASPLEQANLLFANGDFASAHGRYQAIDGAEPFALLAGLELPEAEALASTALPLLLDGPHLGATLAHLLRIERARMAPLLQRLDPGRFAERFVSVWGVAMRYVGDDGVRQALLDPTLDRLEPTSTDALRIMVARASLLYDLGELARSQAVIAPTMSTDATTMENGATLIAHAALIAARIAHRQGDTSAARRALYRWRDHLPFPEARARTAGGRPGRPGAFDLSADPLTRLPLPSRFLRLIMEVRDAVAQCCVWGGARSDGGCRRVRQEGTGRHADRGAEGPGQGRAGGHGAQGRAEGRSQGRAERRAQGRAERRGQGRAQGRAERRAQGRAQGRGQGRQGRPEAERPEEAARQAQEGRPARGLRSA